LAERMGAIIQKIKRGGGNIFFSGAVGQGSEIRYISGCGGGKRDTCADQVKKKKNKKKKKKKKKRNKII